MKPRGSFTSRANDTSPQSAPLPGEDRLHAIIPWTSELVLAELNDTNASSTKIDELRT
jgi:hypothetical protein